MYTIAETDVILNEIAEEIPPELYQQLNGGIVLKEETKLHPQNIGNDLFVMGEYISHPHLEGEGRSEIEAYLKNWRK